MKNVFLLLLSLLVVSPTFAQKLGYKTDNDKELAIGTNYTIDNDLGIAVEFHRNKETNQSVWGVAFIVMDSHRAFSFDKGSRLLIRTFKGNTIELVQYLDVKRIETDYKVYSTVKTEYYARPRYHLSLSDLDKITEEGVKKLRFDSTAGFIDISYETDHVGAIIGTKRGIIQEESVFGHGF